MTTLFYHTNEGANEIAAVAEDDIMKKVKFMVTCDRPLQGDEASSILELKRKILETLKMQRKQVCSLKFLIGSHKSPFLDNKRVRYNKPSFAVAFLHVIKGFSTTIVDKGEMESEDAPFCRLCVLLYQTLHSVSKQVIGRLFFIKIATLSLLLK
ncbi:hypothetical protein KI387_015543, partial [Taxus chinensis]